MRVLLVTHGYPPRAGGVERVSEQTALGLTRAGHHVTVLTRRETAAPALPTLQRRYRDGIEVLMIAGGGPTHARFPFYAPRLERLFERTLLQLTPDVVLVSHLMSHAPTYVAVAQRWGIPVVLELHDFYTVCERAHLERASGELCDGPEAGRACATHCFSHDRDALLRWSLRTRMFDAAVEAADALICPSAFVGDYFRQRFGPTLPPLHVIGNGVTIGPPTFNHPGRHPGPLHFACIGVLMPHKGAHVAIEALRLARLDAARLTLFGVPTHPYFGRLLRAAEQVENLEFRGYGAFEPSELRLLLSDVDAVIIPSLVWESYSIAAREALACGVPVLASRSGALPEAIRHGGNGLLFTPGHASGLAAFIRTLAADPAALAALRDGIRPDDWISVPQRIGALEAVLGEVTAGRSLGSPRATELDELSVLREVLVERS